MVCAVITPPRLRYMICSRIIGNYREKVDVSAASLIGGRGRLPTPTSTRYHAKSQEPLF